MRAIGVVLFALAAVCAGMAFIDLNLRTGNVLLWLIGLGICLIGGLVALIGAKLDGRR